MQPPNVDSELVAGNVFDKYGSRNPLVRMMVRGFLNNLLDLAASTGARDIHEIGCGEGHLTTRLARHGFQVRGSDVSPAILATARRLAADNRLDIQFTEASVYDLRSPRDAAALIVCAEVMEHLPDPDAALGVIRSLARPWALFSVPREPVWRIANLARVRYVRDLGNTPGHVQHWSRAAFVALVRSHFDVVQVRSPFPWTMVLCRVPDPPGGGVPNPENRGAPHSA